MNTKMQALREYLIKHGRDGLCVAFSGGVDSALVLKTAADVLGRDRVAAVTFSSALSPRTEPEQAARSAAVMGVRHFALQIDEFKNPQILENPPERCYLCKKYLFETLLSFSREHRLGAVADGTNADDLKQYRPGLRALRELKILSPLAKCGFSKEDVRRCARELGLASAAKPSAPCLATRIPYGTPLTRELLSRVDAAETFVRGLGFPVCRVRAHGGLVRLEAPPREFGGLLLERTALSKRFRSLGFSYITLDMEGYRSGSMDEILPRVYLQKLDGEWPDPPPHGEEAASAAPQDAGREQPPSEPPPQHEASLTRECPPRAHPAQPSRPAASEETLEELLRGIRTGEVTLEAAADRLRRMPYDDLGFARVDHHRSLRQGFPEVIFCQGKRPEQIAKIARNLSLSGENVLATRADEVAYTAIRALLPEAVYHKEARIVEYAVHKKEPRGLVAVCTAGTADIPVAEEAAVTAEAFGCRVKRIYDVGVAGIHRLFDRLDDIRAADAVITVAGMEGALASVVGGLIERPCVAVPTSVGYGASFGGLSALLTMLNSCSAGVAVVNIDNGFGAGVMAAQIIRLCHSKPQKP